MILVVFGTTGELIKLAPVLRRLDQRRYRYLLVTTGQQAEQIPGFARQLGLRQPDVWLARGAGGRDLRLNRNIPVWLVSVVSSFARLRGSLREELARGPGRPLVLVHGDTMTTVLGAGMGRVLGVPVAHIEGGLRSFDLRHPFPEELNRRAASQLAHIHYAPGPWAASNLRRGEVVDTGSNTIRDSLELVPEGEPAVAVPSAPFGIVSLHRFELLNRRRLFSDTLRVLADGARRTPLVFIDHPVTVAAIERFRLQGLFDCSRFVRVPRLPFFDFIRLERRCAFVVTDSGGTQEECFYLDRPCLVHRLRTERREGLGENAVLSRLRVEVLRDFLRDPTCFRRRTPVPAQSPSETIVMDLERRGFAAPGKAEWVGAQNPGSGSMGSA